MPVYFIQAGGPTGPIKIGHGDPQSRRDDCQVGNHLELRIIRVFEGGKPEEDALHDRFVDLWIRGEWHNFTRTMLGDVGLVEIAVPSVELPPSPDSICAGDPADAASIGLRIRELRKSRGMTQAQLATAIGVSRGSIGMIETGHDLPGRDALWRMSRFFCVPFEISNHDQTPPQVTTSAEAA